MCRGGESLVCAHCAGTKLCRQCEAMSDLGDGAGSRTSFYLPMCDISTQLPFLPVTKLPPSCRFLAVAAASLRGSAKRVCLCLLLYEAVLKACMHFS